MSTTTFGFTGAHPVRAASSGAAHLVGVLAQGWRLWQAKRAMALLDDAALHDIGLTRGAIDDAVRHGRRTPRRR